MRSPFRVQDVARPGPPGSAGGPVVWAATAVPVGRTVCKVTAVWLGKSYMDILGLSWASLKSGARCAFIEHLVCPKPCPGHSDCPDNQYKDT